jgi:hypothetical protein
LVGLPLHVLIVQAKSPSSAAALKSPFPSQTNAKPLDTPLTANPAEQTGVQVAPVLAEEHEL